jgi:regulator of nucleoside diphosphate kinase
MRNLIISQLDSVRIRQIFSSGKVFTGKEGENLLGEINRAKIVTPKKIPSDVVTMNSVVKIKNIDMNKEYIIKLVYPEAADPRKGYISILAPVAAAILGYRKGDIIDWMMPSGNTKILVEEILYQPEAAGDYHL